MNESKEQAHVRIYSFVGRVPGAVGQFGLLC